MSDEELAEIEEVIPYSGESYLRYAVRKIIAEVRRLKAENEQMAINHEREIARMNGVLDGFDL